MAIGSTLLWRMEMRVNIDLIQFNDYLDSLYIKRKTDRNKIINIYRRLFKQQKSIAEFEEKLEELGWDEITIKNISRYILVWNYREEENKRIWKNKNK